MISVVNVSPEVRRKARRTAVQWPVLVVSGDTRTPSAIIDISELGAKLELQREAPIQSNIFIVGANIGTVAAHVVWRRAMLVGVSFTDPTASKVLLPLLRTFAPPKKFGRNRRAR